MKVTVGLEHAPGEALLIDGDSYRMHSHGAHAQQLRAAMNAS